MFDYNATADGTTAHKRQDGSHFGFKTHSSPKANQERYVVMGVDMCVASARRLTACHHNVSVTVLDKTPGSGNGSLHEVWLWRCVISLNKGKNERTRKKDKRIVHELSEGEVVVICRLNIMNEDGTHADSVDVKLQLNGGCIPTKGNTIAVVLCIYE